MEMIRDIRSYPWLRILGTVCILAPTASAVYFFPGRHGRWDVVLVVIWLETTIHFSALCQSWYRLSLAARDKRSVEKNLQFFAVMAQSLFGGSSVDFRNVEGRSAATLMLGDRDVLISAAMIATSLVFVAMARRRPFVRAS